MQVAVAAMENLSLAMKALAASTAALESDMAIAEQFVHRAPDGTVTVGPGPTRPETPRLLPVVVQAWPGLMVALQDERTAAVEAALALLAGTIQAAGVHIGLFRRFWRIWWLADLVRVQTFKCISSTPDFDFKRPQKRKFKPTLALFCPKSRQHREMFRESCLSFSSWLCQMQGLCWCE